MAQLRHVASGQIWSLRQSCQLGRRPDCWIPLKAPCTSGRHAQLIHAGGRWLIFDLDSRNGTRLRDRPVGPIATPLEQGQRIALGSATGEVFEVVHVQPPEPIAAVVPGLTRRVVGEDGVICLQADAHTLLVSKEAGQWLMQRDDAPPEPVLTDQIVPFGGEQWALILPSSISETVEGQATETCTLVIQHSQDLEDFELAIRHPSQAMTELGARTYGFMLYMLAQRLIADQADPMISPAEAGWTPVRTMLMHLTRGGGVEVERKHVNLYVMRFRRLMERFVGPDLDGPRIERRSTSDRIRLAGPVVLELLGQP